VGAERRSVVVTGASSGIGRAIALELSRKGFRVFASVRKPGDAEALRTESDGAIEPIELDLEHAHSIVDAQQVVERALGGDGLDALVNNAGISVTGPLELIPIETLDRQLRVNVTAQVAVTQAFLPLLRKTGGRIVFMGSETGRMTPPLMGPYAASKHALEAVADAFRRELYPTGIRVTILEPGSVRSEIWRKADEHNAARAANDPRMRELYGREADVLQTMPSQIVRFALRPERVARLTRRVLNARWPRARYVMGLDARFLIAFYNWLPTRFTDFATALTLRLLARLK
jgi:NAD(P)-dependent dehydrogenase (short-subunit alcohol dehydrogenase family)